MSLVNIFSINPSLFNSDLLGSELVVNADNGNKWITHNRYLDITNI